MVTLGQRKSLGLWGRFWKTIQSLRLAEMNSEIWHRRVGGPGWGWCGQLCVLGFGSHFQPPPMSHLHEFKSYWEFNYNVVFTVFEIQILAWKPSSEFTSEQDKRMKRLYYMDTCPEHYNKYQSYLLSDVRHFIPYMAALWLWDECKIGKMVVYILSSVFQWRRGS